MDVQQLTADDKVFARARVDDLKGRSVRGGVVAIIAQGIKFALQTASMMILARLLSPEDYGLQGMVVAFTGFLGLFKDAGLSLATVQRDEVTRDQVSTLFWINFGVGAVLTGLAAVLAPLLVYFYREPRLYWVVVISATAFLFNGLGTQHQALLQRHLRFVTLAKIDVLSLGISSGIGIAMALLGQRYWALVGAAVSASLISTIGAWVSVPSTRRQMPSGFSSRSGGGSTCCGALCQLTGRMNRRVAVMPTEVKPGDVVAG